MYVINLDRQHGVIEAKLSGMISIEEVAAYVSELQRIFIMNKLRCYAMVIDVSECPIQHQDIIRAMGAHMATMPKAKSLAIVTGSSLARMQIRRLFTQPYARIVTSTAEGWAWVKNGIEPPVN